MKLSADKIREIMEKPAMKTANQHNAELIGTGYFTPGQPGAAAGTEQPPEGVPMSKAVERELDLHNEIIAFCNKQWPKWKYVHADPTRRSCIAKGWPDFTILVPGNRVLIGECKDKDGKLSVDQRNCHHEIQMLDIDVKIWRSMDDFLRDAIPLMPR